MQASPTGPSPITIAASPGAIPDLATAWTPTASGSVSAAISWAARRHLDGEQLVERHVLGVSPADRSFEKPIGWMPVASKTSGTDTTTSPTARFDIPAPTSTTSQQNSWPITRSPVWSNMFIVGCSASVLAFSSASSSESRRDSSPCWSRWRSLPEILHDRTFAALGRAGGRRLDVDRRGAPERVMTVACMVDSTPLSMLRALRSADGPPRTAIKWKRQWL